MITLYIGPVLSLAIMGCIIYAYFSACRFLYKTWQRGRRLKACPQWEELQQTNPPAGSVRTGPVVRKPVSGWILVTLGGLLFLWDLVLMGKAVQGGNRVLISAAFLPLAAVFAFLAFGVQRLRGTRMVNCPFCGKSVKRDAGIPYYICCYCKRPSIRQGDMLAPEDAVRAMPRFRDLPKF